MNRIQSQNISPRPTKENRHLAAAVKHDRKAKPSFALKSPLFHPPSKHPPPTFCRTNSPLTGLRSLAQSAASRRRLKIYPKMKPVHLQTKQRPMHYQFILLQKTENPEDDLCSYCDCRVTVSSLVWSDKSVAACAVAVSGSSFFAAINLGILEAAFHEPIFKDFRLVLRGLAATTSLLSSRFVEDKSKRVRMWCQRCFQLHRNVIHLKKIIATFRQPYSTCLLLSAAYTDSEQEIKTPYFGQERDLREMFCMLMSCHQRQDARLRKLKRLQLFQPIPASWKYIGFTFGTMLMSTS